MTTWFDDRVLRVSRMSTGRRFSWIKGHGNGLAETVSGRSRWRGDAHGDGSPSIKIILFDGYVPRLTRWRAADKLA
jgi:hypothetical protein